MLLNANEKDHKGDNKTAKADHKVITMVFDTTGITRMILRCLKKITRVITRNNYC